MKNQSFVKGAIILMVANAISKILGAVFKIPLTYILQEEGMAIYNSAFQIYALFLSFVISGIPFAEAKLISEYSATQEKEKVVSTIKMSRRLLLCFGVIGTVLLYFMADFFAISMKEERATFAIKMLSPSVLFVALAGVYKSYFQGMGNMIPTAVSQIIESVIKLCLGYIGAIIFVGYGCKLAAGGAAIGVSIGEIVATAVLFVFYKFAKKNKIYAQDEKEVMQKIIEIAFPLLIASVISSFLSVADTSILRKRLIDFGYSIEEARFLYGAYTGYALTVFHLPVGILATFGVSILPVVAGALAKKNFSGTKMTTAFAIKLSIILSMPCAIAMFFLPDTILEALFGNSTSAKMLSMVSPCVVFLCIAQICISILNASGRISIAFSLGAITALAKIILSFVFVGKVGFYGTIAAANISYFVYMIMSFESLRRVIGLKFDFMEIIIKPSASVIIMSVVILFSKEAVYAIFANVYLRLGVLAALSGIAYLLSCFLLGSISVKEIKKAVAK